MNGDFYLRAVDAQGRLIKRVASVRIEGRYIHLLFEGFFGVAPRDVTDGDGLAYNLDLAEMAIGCQRFAGQRFPAARWEELERLLAHSCYAVGRRVCQAVAAATAQKASRLTLR